MFCLAHANNNTPSVSVTGTGMLKIDFVGELNDKMKGFYRSKYTTPTGDTRYAAVTQFEVCAIFLFSGNVILNMGFMLRRSKDMIS